MEASKGKPFLLDHCWVLLQRSEKWKLREHEAPPKRGALIQLDDDEDDDAPPGGRNKNKPDGNKMAKEKLKKLAENSSLREKIDLMVSSNELMVAKTLEAKIALAEKKTIEKQARWEALRQDSLRKAAVEERKAAAEETKAMAKLLAEENNIMTMNRSTMDEVTLEWHDQARRDILERRRAAAMARGHAPASGGGHGGGVDGGGGGGHGAPASGHGASLGFDA